MNRAAEDYHVELSGLQGQQGRLAEAAARGAAARGEAYGPDGVRPWLAVHWRCCEVYSRVYRSPDGLRYEGRCPKCAKPVSVRIGPAGTHARFFEAY
ncbi:MAG: hypothetical protein AAGA57_05635 [Planctomycetota bacterium]